MSLKFLVLGAGWHACRFCELLVAKNFSLPIVVTYPKKEHERDKILLKHARHHKDIYVIANNLGISLFDHCTSDESILAVAKEFGVDIIVSFSWRYRISANLIEAMNGQIFNLHPSILPYERGSGTFSYRIMNEKKFVAATLHQVDEGLDTGPVSRSKSKEIDDLNLIPQDLLIETNNIYDEILDEFLEECKLTSDLFFHLKKQNPLVGSYLPLLNTEVNGVLDLNWSIDEVERFIRAFSLPYPGASCRLDSLNIQIPFARIKNREDFHPYLVGRVYFKNIDGSVDVLLKDGVLNIPILILDSKKIAAASIAKFTSRFWSHPDDLLKAKVTVMKANEMMVPTHA